MQAQSHISPLNTPEPAPWLDVTFSIEILNVVFVVLSLLGCLLLTSEVFWKTTLWTALFASLNFRLLVWSWKGLLDWKQQRVSRVGMVLRFALKFLGFFGGLWLLLTTRPLPALAVLVGFSPLLLAMVCSPFFLKSE